MTVKMLRDSNLRVKVVGKQDLIEATVSELSEEETKAGENNNRRPPYHFNAIQRSRIFACICVARHLHGANDNDETFNRDIYETTLDLLKPHMERMQFIDQPPYNALRRVWIDFIRTGLVNGKQKLTSKSHSKGLKLPRDESILNNADKSRKVESSYSYIYYGLPLLLLMMLIFLTISAQGPITNSTNQSPNAIQIDFNRVDAINKRFPDLLAPKNLKMIKARLAMMQREVSILMLLGSAHDEHCRRDPTHCVGLMIANVSQSLPYGYINASDPKLTTRRLIGELNASFDNNRHSDRSGVVIIDSLNRLPGNEVMNLFQFIDRDEYKKRQGLLLLILYTDSQISDHVKMRNADIAEKVLLRQWSSYVPADTLTSVISRISGSIVRVH